VFSGFVGGAIGLTAMLLANCIRLEPILRAPWHHIWITCSGIFIGHNMEKYIAKHQANYEQLKRYHKKRKELMDQSTEELDVSWKSRATA